MQLPDSTYLGAAISAADGTFVLESEPENYQLIVQHLLYQTRLVEGQTHDAGIIVLESKDYNLDEVVIEGERPFVTVKFVYRFGGSINKEKKEVDASRFGH